MRLLLDTGAFIRWHDGTLKSTVSRKVQHASVVYVSAVTAWEISAKAALGKLRFIRSVEDVVAQYGFVGLPLTMRHGDRVGDLPLHHGDPFDRMLIAQAIDEGLTILTSDRAFELYQVSLEWA